MIADLTLDATIADMAGRALAFAPQRFALAALSMGGYVAFEIMRQAPDRVLRLALFDTNAGADTPERVRQRRAGLDSLKLGRFSGVTRTMLPQLVHLSHVNDSVGDRVRQMAERVGSDTFVRQQTAILDRIDSRPVLSQISVPTLVAVGDGDVLTPPREAEAIHRGIAGSTLHVFKDCGHLPPIEQPDETMAALRTWLAQSMGVS
jgi:pimeloyl-ACP methyl ester carboxylesterase